MTAPVICELLEDAEQLMPSTLTAAEALAILTALRSLTEATLRCYDPARDWAPAMRCFSGWPKEFDGPIQPADRRPEIEA